MASTFEEMNQPRVEILGVPISVVTMEAALEYISQHLEQLRGGYVCAANVHTTVTAHENQDFFAGAERIRIDFTGWKASGCYRKTKKPGSNGKGHRDTLHATHIHRLQICR